MEKCRETLTSNSVALHPKDDSHMLIQHMPRQTVSGNRPLRQTFLSPTITYVPAYPVNY